jgi:protocatechuate 3,4-dioxygenase beta subunit
MRQITIVGVALLSMTLTGSSAAQTQVQTIQIRPDGPVIDGMPMLPGQGRQFKTGTGRIRGRLTAIDTSTPVRRAQVRIAGPEILTRTAVTDNDGRYEFRDLPAGKFTISATKAGYVSMNYGQRRPFEAGKTIELADAQALDKADIAMPRGGAIAGRLVDEFGEPIADAFVTALRSAWTNGRRRLQPAGRPAQTNDLGQYRIYGLPPGEYYVSATSRSGGGDFMTIDNAGGDLAGVRATFVTSMMPGGPAGPTASEPRTGYAPTYYPGTANGAEAQRIQLAAGQEIPSADFGLLPVRLARVTGTVVGSDGRPVEGAMIQTLPRNANEAGAMIFPMAGSARSDRDGRFALNNVAPGEYTLQVRGIRVMTAPAAGGGEMVFTTRIAAGGDGESEFASVPLSVAGDDVANVMVVTSKGASVSGRVVFEGGSRPSGTVRIMASPIEIEGPLGVAATAAANADGAFEIKGLMGQRMIRPTGLPGGWILKSVTVNGTDITDSGLTMKPNQPVTGVEVVLTSKTTEIIGTVMAGNTVAEDYTVVIFSTDAEKWTAPMTRHIGFARPNQQGRYQVRNLPPGSYYAIAVPYIAQGDWQDPEVLTRLRASATDITLSEGETQTLNLKLSGN